MAFAPTTVTCTAAGGSSSGLTSTTAGGVSVTCWNSDDASPAPPNDVAVVAATTRVAGEVGAGTPTVDGATPVRMVATAVASKVANVKIAAAGELSVADGISALGPNAWSLFR